MSRVWKKLAAGACQREYVVGLKPDAVHRRRELVRRQGFAHERDKTIQIARRRDEPDLEQSIGVVFMHEHKIEMLHAAAAPGEITRELHQKPPGREQQRFGAGNLGAELECGFGMRRRGVALARFGQYLQRALELA